MSRRRNSPVRVPSLSALLGGRVHGDVEGERGKTFAEVYRLVRRIPRGRVMTYGQIGTLIGGKLSPRAVGWAMHGCPDGVPWQRVVNASGGCSTDRLPGMPPQLQQALLEQEGIEFRENGTLDLERHRWLPPEHRPGRRAASRKKPAKTKAARKKRGAAVTRT